MSFFLACTPIVSVGFVGIFAGWLAWILISLFLLRSPVVTESKSDVTYAASVPAGCLAFSVPMFGVLLIPMVIYCIAFTMHLAVEFVASWSARTHRPARMLRYGIPLALTVAIGIHFKYELYSQNGGWRVFWYNYSGGNTVFFMFCVAVGFVLLVKAARRQKQEAS